MLLSFNFSFLQDFEMETTFSILKYFLLFELKILSADDYPSLSSVDHILALCCFPASARSLKAACC